MHCPNCGHLNVAAARFCASCGTSLADQSFAKVPPVQLTAAAPPAPPAVQVVYAGFWIRFVSWLIDAALFWLASLFVGLFMAIVADPWPPGQLVVWAAAMLYWVLMTGLKGQTVGKMAMGIMVVRANGNLPGIGYAALREMVGKFVSGTFLLVGFIWTGFDPQKQGWHDKIASTYVVRVTRPRL